MASVQPTLPFLPPILPLVPLRPPYVLYPFLQVTVSLPGTHVSVILQAIAENVKQLKNESTERLVAVVPVIEIDRRVGRWATAARLKSITRSKDSTKYEVTLEGLARIRLPASLPPVLSILPPLPLITSTYSLPLPLLHSTTAAPVLTLALPLLPSPLPEKLGTLPTGLLCDILATLLGLDWEARVELLSLIDVDDRSKKLEERIRELLSGKGIKAPPVPASKSTSSALIVRRQPGRSDPSSRGPSPLPDDLRPLEELLSRRTQELSGLAYHTIQRELNRLSKIPAQSAEYSVTKTYLEVLLALPWKKTTPDVGLDLEESRRRLEEEHEGLQEVKRRVIEYLAVFRLKKKLFEQEVAKASASSRASSNQTEGDQAIMDNSTASELLELVPPAERKSVEEPLPPKIEDSPSTDVYRDKGPILLLVGPPGVGKTSIARSLADSMGRRFHRISLGGVRDEAEIRGHRRTYVGALPGLLVQALRRVGVSNPVILLDELDKVSTSSFHGDPSAALLEALDPAQNWQFHDHYLGEVPIDLSQVTFIATANTLETINTPLLDRCEVITCSGYTMEEKVKIAKRFLVKKQINENGMKRDLVKLDDDLLRRMIEDYTRESGVRSLERTIGKVMRYKAVQFSRADQDYKPKVSIDELEAILGIAKFESEVREVTARPGVVHGLSYKGSGMGGILVLEAVLLPGKGRLRCTGMLGEVIQESAELALTWIKSRAGSLGVGNVTEVLKTNDIHLHLPSGAIKKDGPSAGIAMVIAFISLLSDRPVTPTTAFTGEITLRGAVTPVGGIKEKVLGAHRAGITRIIMSRRNRKDIALDIPEEIKREIGFDYVDTIEQALHIVWPDLEIPKGQMDARL